MTLLPVGAQVRVRFVDGQRDAFWREELARRRTPR